MKIVCHFNMSLFFPCYKPLSCFGNSNHRKPHARSTPTHPYTHRYAQKECSLVPSSHLEAVNYTLPVNTQLLGMSRGHRKH